MSPAVLYRQLPGVGLSGFITKFREAAARDPFGTVFIVPTSSRARELRLVLLKRTCTPPCPGMRPRLPLSHPARHREG